MRVAARELFVVRDWHVVAQTLPRTVRVAGVSYAIGAVAAVWAAWGQVTKIDPIIIGRHKVLRFVKRTRKRGVWRRALLDDPLRFVN